MNQNNNLINDVANAISKIDNDICTLQNKKQFLINLKDVEFVDFGMWKKILDTPLSHDTDAILKILQKSFPGAEHGYYGSYCYTFSWKDIEISLPTVINQTVSIDTDWFYKQSDILTEKTAVLVEELLPILDKFGANVRQWGVKSNPSENDRNLDKIKEAYYEEKEKRELEHTL